MSEVHDPAHLMDELAEEFARRWRAGEHPSIEEFAQRHPGRADEVRAVLLAVEMMEQLKPRPHTLAGGRIECGTGSPAIPARIGDYRIVREIGRGGMGVVYEAVEESLGRRVALKVLQPGLVANERSRSRFRRESQAAGRLHHTNIVPVFGVGERDGHCFYVMQLIEGRGLDQVIRHGLDGPLAPPPADLDPTLDLATPHETAPAPISPPVPPPPPGSQDYFRTIARLASQVADALAHAHAHGILHRDIKPSNLILDAQGTVWITDFGVAKLTEEVDLTQSGELVGTLKYMPPERFAGVTDARGDLYSLGISVYELLTRRSAFPDTSPPHLLQIINTQAPPGPRTIDPLVPRDLETIVLKAITRDPALRYGSAEDMAADLRRFLDDRPIQAKRTSSAERFWRWCRRNKALAGAVLMAALLLLGITIVSVAAYARTAQANREVEQALESESEQRRQAEQVSTLALAALNRTYHRFAPTRQVVTPQGSNVEGVEVPVQPALPPEAVPLLEDLLRTYEKLAQAGGKFPRTRSLAAEANFRIGDIRQRLGRSEEAVSAFRSATSLYTDLLDEEDDAIRIKLARAYNELGRTLRTLGKHDEAFRMHEEAIRVLKSSPALLAERPETRYELARSYFTLGKREMLLQEPPNRPGRRQAPGPPGRDLPPGGQLRSESTNRAAAILERLVADRAAEILERLVREFPSVPEYRHLLACCYGTSPSSGRGVELLRKLVKEHPRVPDYRLDLCEILGRGGPGHGERPQRRERLQEAIDLSRQLVEQYPDVPDYTAAQARYLDRMGLTQFEAGDFREAARMHRRALELQTRLVARCPDVVAYTFWQSLIERALGRALGECGEPREGRDYLQRAIERAEALQARDARLVGIRPFLGMAYRDLARSHTLLGDSAASAEALRKAEGFGGERRPNDGPPGRRGPRK